MSDIRVKVADYAVRRAAGTISTIGLGSCVAIVLYDVESRVGGIAHVLLPTETLSRDHNNPAKFPATAVPLLVDEMRRLGARGMPTARIAGGASMFTQLLPTNTVNMGERNIVATKQALERAQIPLVACDVGGDWGRSVFLDVATGRLLIRSLKQGERVL
ncbi:MAG: chemotaxis protein CheD [Vulcanimicrobiaceae bacterium]